MNKKIVIILIGCIMSSCSRNDFLNVSPDQSHVVPTTLDELRALLDRDQVMNGIGSGGSRGPVPNLAEARADDYYYLEANFSNLQPQQQNYYVWKKSPYVGDVVYDWNRVFEAVFYANVALDGLKNITPNANNREMYNEVKGTGLFHRAHAYYQLAQIYAPPYEESTSDILPGLPLRLEADFSENVQRGSVEETYDRILTDLLDARELLPPTTRLKNRPSQIACDALLARVYLAMRKYDLAEKQTDSFLSRNNILLDYNQVNASVAAPFHQLGLDNPEIIMTFNMQGSSSTVINRSASAKVAPDLYALYGDNDLRKELFYRASANGVDFKGNYSGTSYFFAGIATDEVYLTKAECLVRRGQVIEGMNFLRTFLSKRYSSDYDYANLDVHSKEDALNVVLEERRKQLVYRGIRWMDLRRLNLEGFNITQRREVNGEVYHLPPNDERYTLPYPDNVLEFNPEWR